MGRRSGSSVEVSGECLSAGSFLYLFFYEEDTELAEKPGI